MSKKSAEKDERKSQKHTHPYISIQEGPYKAGPKVSIKKGQNCKSSHPVTISLLLLLTYITPLPLNLPSFPPLYPQIKKTLEKPSPPHISNSTFSLQILRIFCQSLWNTIPFDFLFPTITPHSPSILQPILFFFPNFLSIQFPSFSLHSCI